MNEENKRQQSQRAAFRDLQKSHDRKCGPVRGPVSSQEYVRLVQDMSESDGMVVRCAGGGQGARMVVSGIGPEPLLVAMVMDGMTDAILQKE